MGWMATKAGRALAKEKRLKRMTGDACHKPKPPKIIHGERGRRKINSRRKGAVGELEFAEFLNRYELNARRGQQFAGGTDSPDVIVKELTGVHFEVKRAQALLAYQYLAQAEKDAKSKLPIVAFRRNNQKWLAIVDMDVMVQLLLIREGNYL